MKRILTIFALMTLTLSLSAGTKGIKEFHSYFYQYLDPNPREDGGWRIGEVKELNEPYVILYSKNYIRIENTSYFIDKATLRTVEYTEEENPGYAKCSSFVARDMNGVEIFVSMEYANRENPNIYGFSIFKDNNKGKFFIAELQR